MVNLAKQQLGKVQRGEGELSGFAVLAQTDLVANACCTEILILCALVFMFCEA